MPKLFMLIACCSFLWNFSIPERYMRFEQGEKLCGRRPIRLLLLKLAGKVGCVMARNTALAIMFAIWLALCWYFMAVIAFFHVHGPKVVAVVAATLATLSFGHDMAHAHRNFTEWCYSQEDNAIFLAKGCWEIVLAGLVVINMVFFS